MIKNYSNRTMRENTNGVNETLNGLETMAENLTGYRELLCTLEMSIEMENWFSNTENGYKNHQRLSKVAEKIIPEITHNPFESYGVETFHDAERHLRKQHTQMSIYAAERAVEFWIQQ